MSDQPNNDTQHDEILGTEQAKAIAENNQRIRQTGDTVDELNKRLHEQQAQADTQPAPDNQSPQDMSADEFFGTGESPSRANEGGLMGTINDTLEDAGLNLNTQNILVQLAVQFLPLPYARKRYLQNKARRGETVTVVDVLIGDMSLGRIIRSAIGIIIFIAIAVIASQQ